MDKKLEIPIDGEITRFRNHLDQNGRIIFSAKFGDGKTTFLREFQNAEAQADSYFLTIHPVNYSVATNEDIFEYIKRDILYQLHRDGWLNEVDLDAIFDSILTWEFFQPLVSHLLSFIPGGPFYEKLIKKAMDFKDEYDKRKKTWEEYSLTFTNQRGGLYEDDGHTKLIKGAVDWIQKVKEKKVVLIIEDLDRLDPAHLFRILNVLGAHIDIDDQHNKFNVDNIIIVMDYEATEQIFKHFYGEHANYDGYMSKFYTRYKYDYSIKRIAREHLRKLMIENYHVSESAFNIKLNERTYGVPITLNGVLSQLSVRRVVQILSDFETSLNRQVFHSRSHGDVYLDAPILYLLILIVRLNEYCYKDTILESINQQNIIFELFGAFLLSNDALMA